MSQKAPAVLGTVSGSDLLDMRELAEDQDLELGAEATLKSSRGVDLLERARFDADKIHAPGVKILTAETEYTGNDFVMQDSDTTWRVLPAARIEAPRLLRNARIDFELCGIYFNNGSVTQTIELELVLDGTPTGDVLSWALTAPTSYPSAVVLTAILRACHLAGPSEETLYDVEARLRINEGFAYATVIDSTKFMRPASFDGAVDRIVGWRIRRALAQADEALLIRSISAWQLMYRSGC